MTLSPIFEKKKHIFHSKMLQKKVSHRNSSDSSPMYDCAICNVSYFDSCRSGPSPGRTPRSRSKPLLSMSIRLRSRALAARRRFFTTWSVSGLDGFRTLFEVLSPPPALLLAFSADFLLAFAAAVFFCGFSPGSSDNTRPDLLPRVARLNADPARGRKADGLADDDDDPDVAVVDAVVMGTGCRP